MALRSVQHRPTTAEINLDNLRHNIGEIKKRLPTGVSFVPVIKANAYGHGAIPCARALRGAGIKQMAVATVEEGLALREAGVSGEILILGGVLCEDPADMLTSSLKPVIHQMSDLERLGEFVSGPGINCGVHLKIDTGMGRLGFLPSEIEALIKWLRRQENIRVDGILTHLARADEEDSSPTDKQFALFHEIQKQFADKGIIAPVYHIANSAAIIDGKLDDSAWVRPGLMLYGCYPHPRHREKIQLKPVMTFKTSIMGIKRHEPGSPISYGGTFVTKRESLIALLPVGYADGYPRLLSNRGQVLIRGQRVPIVGRVCMDITMVDVTDIEGAAIGDDVILIGSQETESISAEEVAGWAETISYEIVCGISSRVPRVYTGL